MKSPTCARNPILISGKLPLAIKSLHRIIKGEKMFVQLPIDSGACGMRGLLAGNFDIFAKGMVAYERALWKSQRGLQNIREIVNRNSEITPNEKMISEITPIV